MAIELAAARLTALSVEELARRIDDRFRLLTGGRRTALPRQRTLRALVDWSYDLLSADERIVLNTLAVFAGGFSLDAAERVCAADALSETTVLDAVEHLVAKSLLIVEQQHETGTPRGSGEIFSGPQQECHQLVVQGHGNAASIVRCGPISGRRLTDWFC